MTPQTLYGRLIDSHPVATLDEQIVLRRCDLYRISEYARPQAFAELHDQGHAGLEPSRTSAVVRHIAPSHLVPHRGIHASALAMQALFAEAGAGAKPLPTVVDVKARTVAQLREAQVDVDLAHRLILHRDTAMAGRSEM